MSIFSGSNALERLINDKATTFGDPLPKNNAVMKDLVNHNYRLEHLQNTKKREDCYQRNINEIMLRIKLNK